MANENSRKGFLAVTLVTVLSVVAVLTVYAVLIGTFSGGDVTVGGMGLANVRYNTTNVDGTWSATLDPDLGESWYSRLEIDAAGFAGNATIVWQLQKKEASSYTNVDGASVSTTVYLTGAAQTVYASSDGAITNNRDWSTGLTAGTYRVLVTVNSA